MNAAIQECLASSGRGEATAFDLPKGSEVYRSHAVILGRNGRLLADIPIDGLVVEVAPDGRALVARPTHLGLVDVRLERLNLSR